MTQISSYEIDFLPVGSGERSGDAIAIRWKEGEEFKVLVYDGGTQESGAAIVSHIQTFYGTSRVDYLVSSHPDSDHASGLSVVLDELSVGEVWMHRPWEYSALIRDYFHDGRITDDSLAERLKAKMAAAYAVEEAAVAKSIPVHEPFQGCAIGPFTVLSPPSHWYVHELIPAFEKSPKVKTATSAADSAESLYKIIKEVGRAAADWVVELWSGESLREDVLTSAENLSSVVLHAVFDGRGILITGDAGVETLHRAADYADTLGLNLPTTLGFVQVPHHGSRNNVSTSALDRVVGPKKPVDDGAYSKTAFVSAGKDSTTHPRKIVVNAFMRRGAQVVATQGQIKCHYRNMPARADWVNATPLTFSGQVESWD
jgi:beta-lactamase superfamily II metal-dependent hydrolase